MSLDTPAMIDSMIAMAGGVPVTCASVTVKGLTEAKFEHLGTESHAPTIAGHKAVAVRTGALPGAVTGAAIVVAGVSGRVIDKSLHDEGALTIIVYATP